MRVRFISREEVAKLLCISVRTLDGLVAANKIDHYRIGQSVRFAPSHIKAYLRSCTVRAKTDEVKPAKPAATKRPALQVLKEFAS